MLTIKANVAAGAIAPTVNIQFQDEVLTFSVSYYRRDTFNTSDYDVFSQINAYWNDLPVATQSSIFEIYRLIEDAFETVFSTKDLESILQEKVALLMQHHQPEDVARWIAFRGDIQIPAAIPNTYVHSVDNNTTREKTYIAADYQKLVGLALILRTMIPIWGEYISSIRSEVGNDFKESVAFKLLSSSCLMQTPAMEKLLEYIDHIVTSAGTYKPSNILKGISRVDYPRHNLAVICIRNLATGDIRGNNSMAHLVTFIHMSVASKLENKDSGTESEVRFKKDLDDDASMDNQSSTLERYKIKFDKAVGETVELEFALSDHERVARGLLPGIDLDALRAAQVTIKRHQGVITTPQLNLMRSLFKPVVSSQGPLYLTNPSEPVALLAVVQTVLWQMGFQYLAVLMSSYPVLSEVEMTISPADSKQRVPKHLQEQLDALFPYRRSLGNRKTPPFDSNYANDSIDLLVNALSLNSWRPTADDKLLVQVFGQKVRRIPVKPDIKTDLAQLVIEMHRVREAIPPQTW